MQMEKNKAPGPGSWQNSIKKIGILLKLIWWQCL
jgi:hypothetical protein